MSRKRNVFGTRHSIYKLSKNPGTDIDGCQIERVNSFKLPGVYVDEILTWESHIENIFKKVTKGLGVLRRLRPYVPKMSSSPYITL